MPDTRHDPGIPTLTVRAEAPNEPPVLTQVVERAPARERAEVVQALQEEIDGVVRDAVGQAALALSQRLEREIPALVERVLREHGQYPETK